MGENKGENKGGRPTKYSKDIGEEICERIALGESLISICRDNHMPYRSTVIRWAIDVEHEFCDTYKRAREMQQEHYLDEMVEIADDSSNDYVSTDDGMAFDREHVQRSKLRIETRRWIMERLGQKRYGNKQEVNHKSSDKSMTPSPAIALTPEQIDSFNKKFDDEY